VKDYDEISKTILGDITRTCIDNKIKLVITGDSAILHEDGSWCAGWFEGKYDKPEKDILTFAAGVPFKDWVLLALHEGSHMDQYLERAPEWLDCIVAPDIDSTDALFAWVSGQDIPFDVLDVAMRSLHVERDAEKRTVAKILKYGLQDLINTVEYTKQSNAYIYFYLFLIESRKWSERGRAPYALKEIWEHAPDTFDNDYTQIPDALLAAFREHLYTS